MEKLAESLGVTKLSKSQVSVMAAELDEMVTQFRSRPLDAGPDRVVAIPAEHRHLFMTLATEHAALPRPDTAGRSITMAGTD